MENTKLPIEIYTTDELCTEIIRRIQDGGKITNKLELLKGMISFYKEFPQSFEEIKISGE